MDLELLGDLVPLGVLGRLTHLEYLEILYHLEPQ